MIERMITLISAMTAALDEVHVDRRTRARLVREARALLAEVRSRRGARKCRGCGLAEQIDAAGFSNMTSWLGPFCGSCVGRAMGAVHQEERRAHGG